MSLSPRKRIGAAIGWRVDEAVAREVARAVAREVAPLRDEVGRLHGELRELRDGLGENVAFMRSEFDRLTPHVASLETRLADLRDGRLGAASGADAGRALEEERIRIQLQAVSHYEERMRRLEERVAADAGTMSGKDAR